MSVTRYRVVIRLDTSLFKLDIGDSVEKSEKLGYLRGRAVEAPFDAIVEDVCSSVKDAGDQMLLVTLFERQPISE